MAHAHLVCVVDDDPDVLRSTSLFLEAIGFNVVPYASGSEFLTDFPNQRPACVLMDQRMPNLAGTDVLAALRDLGSDVPVILMSGHATAELKNQLLDPSLQLIEKPMDPDLLQRALRIAMPR